MQVFRGLQIGASWIIELRGNMVLLLLAIIMGAAALIWLWKVPIKKIVGAMKKSGSSAFEAYAIVTILFMMMVFTGYLISRIL